MRTTIDASPVRAAQERRDDLRARLTALCGQLQPRGAGTLMVEAESREQREAREGVEDLARDLAAAETAVRDAWLVHVAPARIDEGYDAVLAAIDAWLALQAKAAAAFDHAVAVREQFRQSFQPIDARLYPDLPPVPPTLAAVGPATRDMPTWGAKVRTAFTAWADTWRAAARKAAAKA